MVLVRGNDALSGVEIAQQTSAWNTVATGSGAEVWYTVPLVSESLTYERDTLAVPREMGQTGYREIYEYGRPTVKGSMTVIGRYDAKWFQILLAHAFWREVYTAQSWVNGTALDSGTANRKGNAHIYTFGSTLPKGLSIRVHKGGSSQGYVDVFVGCMIGSFSLEQGDADVIKFTFNFSGYTMTTPTQASLSVTSLPAIGGTIPIRIRDYNQYASTSGDRGYIKVGATLTTLNLKSYRINVDRKLEFDSAFLNNLDDVQQPGVNDQREVTAEFVGSLESGYNDNFKPHKEYLARTVSKADIVLTAPTTSIAGYPSGDATNYPYALRLEFPAIYWTAVLDNLQQGGANDATYRFVAVKGDFSTASNLPDTIDGIAPAGDFRAISCVNETVDSNARFSSASSVS